MNVFPHEMAMFRYHDVNSSRWEGSEFLREKTTQRQVAVHGLFFNMAGCFGICFQHGRGFPDFLAHTQWNV